MVELIFLFLCKNPCYFSFYLNYLNLPQKPNRTFMKIFIFLAHPTFCLNEKIKEKLTKTCRCEARGAVAISYNEYLTEK